MSCLSLPCPFLLFLIMNVEVGPSLLVIGMKGITYFWPNDEMAHELLRIFLFCIHALCLHVFVFPESAMFMLITPSSHNRLQPMIERPY